MTLYRTIDIELALSHLGGSERLYKTLVTGFYDHYKDVDVQIGNLLEMDDVEGARRLAHSLKGLSANLGALELRDKALALEMSIRDKRPDRDDRLNDFSQILKLVIQEAKTILTNRFGH